MMTLVEPGIYKTKHGKYVCRDTNGKLWSAAMTASGLPFFKQSLNGVSVDITWDGKVRRLDGARARFDLQ